MIPECIKILSSSSITPIFLNIAEIDFFNENTFGKAILELFKKFPNVDSLIFDDEEWNWKCKENWHRVKEKYLFIMKYSKVGLRNLTDISFLSGSEHSINEMINSIVSLIQLKSLNV